MNAILRLVTASPRNGAFSATILVRVILGFVFLLAAYRKFTEPADMGPGRFEEMGFANPAFWAYFVGVFELLGGLFVLIGLLTRAAALPLAVTMISAIWITKVPRLPDQELVDVLQASRVDLTMLLLSIYLMIAGGGKWAVDRAFDGRAGVRS